VLSIGKVRLKRNIMFPMKGLRKTLYR